MTTIEGNVPHAGFHKEAEYALGRNYWTVRVTFDRNARPKPENVHDDLVSIGEESCVLDAKKDFMPHPEFEYWDLYDSEKLKRGVYEFIGFRIINIPFINQVFSVIAGGERVLEKAVGTAKAALHYNHKKIWREFWDYGQGWSREPESFGIFPDARVSVHKPNGSTGGARNIADAVITATRAAERWCDTTYTYSRTGEWDSNDNPIYKNEPAIAVYRPEGGNWIVVKEERWKQGEGFVTSEVFRIKCAEGQIRENFE